MKIARERAETDALPTMRLLLTVIDGQGEQYDLRDFIRWRRLQQYGLGGRLGVETVLAWMMT